MSFTNLKPLQCRLGVLCAVLMKAAPFGALADQATTVLHAFSNDGDTPQSALAAGSSGNLYGTTNIGGLVFKVAPDGNTTVLHTFTGFPADGAYPVGTLIVDSAGNFYGATVFGGASGYGVVFKLAPDRTYTLLHAFTGAPTDGDEGNLYHDLHGCVRLLEAHGHRSVRSQVDFLHLKRPAFPARLSGLPTRTGASGCAFSFLGSL